MDGVVWRSALFGWECLGMWMGLGIWLLGWGKGCLKMFRCIGFM